MPCPTAAKVFLYSSVANPEANTDPAAAKPIGVIVEPGDDVDFQLNAAFDCPVDVTVSAFAPGIDPNDIFMIFMVDSNPKVKRLLESVAQSVKADGCKLSGTEDERRKKFENLVFFNTNVTQVNVGLEQLDAKLPPGTYFITLGVTPSGSEGKTSYRWVTSFIVP